MAHLSDEPRVQHVELSAHTPEDSNRSHATTSADCESGGRSRRVVNTQHRAGGLTVKQNPIGLSPWSRSKRSTGDRVPYDAQGNLGGQKVQSRQVNYTRFVVEKISCHVSIGRRIKGVTSLIYMVETQRISCMHQTVRPFVCTNTEYPSPVQSSSCNSIRKPYSVVFHPLCIVDQLLVGLTVLLPVLLGA